MSKDLIDRFYEGMKKIYLVTTSQCPNCEAEKRKIQEEIEKGIVEIVDENHPEFKKIVEDTGIKGVPAYVVYDEKIGKYRRMEEGDENVEINISCEDIFRIDAQEIYYVVGDVEDKSLPKDAPIIKLEPGECKLELEKLGITEPGIYKKKRGKIKKIK